MNKKFLFVLSLLVMLSLMLSACGGGATSARGLLWWLDNARVSGAIQGCRGQLRVVTGLAGAVATRQIFNLKFTAE